MNTDQAGYTYIKTDKGSYRVSRARARAMKGGSPIDDAFQSDEVNKLVWKDKYDTDGNYRPRWEHQYDSWYDKLNVTPDYLLEKCKNKGKQSESLERVLKGPFNRALYDTRPLRNPNPDEVLRERAFDKDLPEDQRAVVENYNREAVKGAEYQAYSGCDTLVPNAPDRLDLFTKVKCDEIMCRDPYTVVGPDGKPVEAERRVHDSDSLARVMAGPLSDADKAKYQHCANMNLYCKTAPHATVNAAAADPFIHVTNAGSGECLFIATAQYLKFTNALEGFPDYENNQIPKERYNRLRPWRTGSRLAYESGNLWRQRAMDWLEQHPNEYIPGGDPATIQETMAKSLLNTIDIQYATMVLAPLDVTITDIYNKFITTISAAAKLGLKPINRTSEVGDRLQDAYNYVIDRDNYPDKAESIQQLISYFAVWYIRALRHPDTYAGATEVYALSRYLNANIHVWSKNGDKYTRIPYMSFNSIQGQDDGNRTINLLFRQNMSNSGLMSGLMHFEIVFPWIKGVKMSTAINSINQFKSAYPDITAVPAQEVNIMLQSLIDTSVQPKSGLQKSFTIDKLNLEYQTLLDIIKTNIGRIDLPVIINGLHRMSIRDIEHYSDMDDRIMNADALYDDSDKPLKIALKRVIKEILNLDSYKSTYNQVLADVIMDLKIPTPQSLVSNIAASNIKIIHEYLSKHPEKKSHKSVEKLRQYVILEVISTFASDMYYYNEFRGFFAPAIYPGSPYVDILKVLTYFKDMAAIIDFDGEVTVKALYVYVELEQDSEQEQEQESESDSDSEHLGLDLDEMTNELENIWEGDPEELEEIVLLQLELLDKDTTIAEMIMHMSEMEMEHTRSNLDILIESLG